MAVVLHDRRGRPTAYSDDGISIFLYNGRPAAYIVGDAVFAYSGKHLGWWQEGVLRDKAGAVAYFSREATVAGLATPATGAEPARGAKGAEPAKGARQALPARPADAIAWSARSGEEFFS